MNNLKKITSIVLCVELLVLVGSMMNGAFSPATVLVGALSSLTNQERQQNNLAKLIVNPLLSEAAQKKAEDMSKNQYFSHVSPDGKTPWFWLELVGYKYDYAGENLAINFDESEDVTNAWMNSPAHRENILKKSYTEMGSGVATGTYQGRDAVFIVQDYASPRTESGSIEKTENNTDNSSEVSATSTQVLGATTHFITSTSTQKLIVVIISIILGIIILAFIIKFLIKYSKKHPVFLNTLLIICAILLGVYILYQLVFKEKTFVVSSTNYSAEDATVVPIENQ